MHRIIDMFVQYPIPAKLRARLAGLLALLAAGISPAQETESPRPLHWMGHWKNEGSRERMVREVLEDFRFVHQEIDVRFEFASDLLPEKTQNAAAKFIAEMIRTGEITWDVIWLDSLIYNSVAQILRDPCWGAKHLVDFAGIPEVRSAHKQSLFNSACRETGGIFTGPHIEGFFNLAWYNAGLAKKLGLTIREQEMTVEDLLGYARRVDEYNRSAEQTVSIITDFKGSGSIHRLQSNLILSAIPGYDGTRALTEAQLDEARRQAQEAFEELAKYNFFSGARADQSWEEAAERLLSGNALFLFDASWRYNMLKDLDPVRLNGLRIAQMPSLHKTAYVSGGYTATWAVLKNSPNRDAAIDLMKFWSRPSIAKKWIQYTKNPTGLDGGLSDAEYGKDPYSVYQKKISQGGLPMIDPITTLLNESFLLNFADRDEKLAYGGDTALQNQPVN